MTIINPNSIAGITSVTAQADIINFYKSDGTPGSLQIDGCNFNTTSGISTFNNVYVGGTITYEDVKNVDSVGIITARAGINLTGGNITLGDSGSSGDDRIHIGAGNDIQLYHYSGVNYIDLLSNTEFRGAGSTIKIKPKTSEEGIVIVPDGQVELYHNNSKKFNTLSDGIHVHGRIQLNDNEKLKVGDTGDIEVFHDGNHSYIDNHTGNLKIRNAAAGNILIQARDDDEGIIVKPDGAVELYYDNAKKFESTSTGVTVTGKLTTTDDILGGDNVVVRLGTGQDLTLWHNGSNSFIKNSTNALTIQSGGVSINDVANAKTSASFDTDGAAQLYHDNAKKLETASWGVDITGDCRASELKLEDGNYLSIGSGNDLRLRHDGTNSVITSSTGSLKILGSEIKFMNAAGTQNGIIYTQSGSVQLYHNNNEMFYTSASGCHVGRPSAAAHLHFLDGGIARFGSSNDLEIYHDASHSRIKTSSSATGNLVIDSNNDINLRVNNSEMSIHCKENGAVELYYDNAVRLQTTSGGVGVTGSINAAGATFGDYIVETNRTSGSSKGFYAKRGGVTCAVLSNHGTGPEGKMELYNNGTMNYSAHGTAGTLALNGYIRFGISNGAGNQLDDYEEGSWTPTLPAGGSATTLAGQYTKIGNKVFWALQVNGLSGSASFKISGLPYNVDNGWGGNISISNNNHSPEHIYVFAHNGSTDIYFRNDSNNTFNVSTFSGNFFYCNGFYETNS